jgi:hypothetical protein
MSSAINTLEPIPGAKGVCSFCNGPRHFGWCEEMRAAYERAVATGGPRPLPVVRSGP